MVAGTGSRPVQACGGGHRPAGHGAGSQQRGVCLAVRQSGGPGSGGADGALFGGGGRSGGHDPGANAPECSGQPDLRVDAGLAGKSPEAEAVCLPAAQGLRHGYGAPLGGLGVAADLGYGGGGREYGGPAAPAGRCPGWPACWPGWAERWRLCSSWNRRFSTFWCRRAASCWC